MFSRSTERTSPHNNAETHTVPQTDTYFSGGSTVTFGTMPKRKRADDDLSGGESDTAAAACPDAVSGTFTHNVCVSCGIATSLCCQCFLF